MSYSTIAEQAMLAKVAEMLKGGGGGGGGSGVDWENPDYAVSVNLTPSGSLGLSGKAQVMVSGGLLMVHGTVAPNVSSVGIGRYRGYAEVEEMPPYKFPWTTLDIPLYNSNFLPILATVNYLNNALLGSATFQFTDLGASPQLIVDFTYLETDNPPFSSTHAVEFCAIFPVVKIQ